MKIINRHAFPLAIVIVLLAATLSFAQNATVAKINVNSASQSELTTLPGMSKKKADKLIAGRPYGSAADLSKSGLSAKQIDKITPLVTFEGGPAAAAAPPAAAPPAPAPSSLSTPTSHKSRSSGTSAASGSENTTAQVPPQPGMVWVSRRSKVYHVEGDRWYGKTKHGEWMTEADAIKAGYHKAK